MTAGLERLLRPRSIAVVGGGAWCASVLGNCAGFEGPVWWVHPTKGDVACIEDLPAPPDAVFIGVNRDATVKAVAALSAMGAGGAICFASGFSEARGEIAGAQDLQVALLAAAGEMPILGPNCYGVLNYLDGVGLWPDVHGGVPVARGVAVIAQSSNIALNLTMQARGLPVAYVVTLGNQAQIGVSAAIAAVAADPRVTAVGLYVESLDDLAAFAEAVRACAVPIVVLKAGRSVQAQAGVVSHTGAMTGASAAASALFQRLGMAEVDSLEAMLAALTLVHVTGGIEGASVVSASCSGGEASLMADLGFGVVFPPLCPAQITGLRAALGEKVALANPLDYHTYIWGDVPAMTATFGALCEAPVDIVCVVLDMPRADRCDVSAWEPALQALEQAAAQSARPLAVIASLPEAMPEDVAARLIAAGVVPFAGMEAGLAAIARVGGRVQPIGAPLVPPTCPREAKLWPEDLAKDLLAKAGVTVPARGGPGPFAVKALGLAHKTEHGGVRLGVPAEAVNEAMVALAADACLVEEMVTDGVVEVLVSVLRDPAHGFLLTLGAGGVEAELWDDRAHLLVPSDAPAIRAALNSLRIAPKLHGYRGKRAVDMEALVGLILAVQDFVTDHAASVEEIEMNPVICTPTRAVAADALLRMAEESPHG